MDRLVANEELTPGEELASANGWARLVLQVDGRLVLYRTQVSRPLWSPDTGGGAVARLAMQADGNIAAFSSQGATLWETGTSGNPGAWLVLQDDGDLVLYESPKKRLWATGTVQDFRTPTVTVTDEDYSYVEVSESWKEICRELPCFSGMEWPGYSTLVLEETIDDEPVVIQLWKGWCPQLLGLSFMAGGVGGEVGIYRRQPGAIRIPPMPLVVKPIHALIRSRVAKFTDRNFWWPFPELGAQLEFTLINPVTEEPVFHAGPERSYWMAKWMGQASYLGYWLDQRGKVPLRPEKYILEYTINGETRRWL
jgi:hypothetical protein